MGSRRFEWRVELRDEQGRPRKGIKDPARIAAFIREVRNADAG